MWQEALNQKIEEKLKKYIGKLYDQHVYLQDQAWLTNNIWPLGLYYSKVAIMANYFPC